MVQPSAENTEQDIDQTVKLFQEMSENIRQVTQLVDNMLLRVKRGEMTTDKGLSFLEVKYHSLLSYLINLSYVILRKSSGETIFEDPAIDRLVELRTVLEKIRPIDRRLKYQIDKLVKTSVSGGGDGENSDATQFKANPSNLMSKLGEEGNSSDDDEDNVKTQSGKSGVYVPPKLTPMHFDGDETSMSRDEKLKERARKRALNSSLVRELREEYMDAPMEQGFNIDGTKPSSGPSGLSRRQKEQQDYEETYFTRLPTTKQQKHRNKKLTTIGSLGDEITTFGGDISALDDEYVPLQKKRKRPTQSTKKGKKSAKKKIRYH